MNHDYDYYYDDVRYIGSENLNWFPYTGPPPYSYGRPVQYPAGPLGTEEGRYLARWHYPYSPIPTRYPHVWLPHKFYAEEETPCRERDSLTGECKDTPEYKLKQLKGFIGITSILILGTVVVLSIAPPGEKTGFQRIKEKLLRKGGKK